jgi:filamentous hemagglutinin
MWLDIAAAGLYGWGNTTALVSGAAVTQADLARRALTADKKILLQQCDAGGQNCTHREVDASQVTVLNGKVYVFNNGIFNDEDMALNNARLQSTDSANAQGVYVIINPKTGNPVAELFYAGYDKINEIMGGAMPISNASEVNQSILQTAATQNGTMDSVNHSRGGLTFANAVGDLNQQGVTDAPIGSVQFNGSAANAQRTANIVDTVSGGQGTVSYSTHATDLVPRIVGGNPATGGNPNFSFPKSHSSYTGYLPPEMVMSDEGVLVANPDRLFTDAAWGNGNTSTTITVKPHDRFKSKSKE